MYSNQGRKFSSMPSSVRQSGAGHSMHLRKKRYNEIDCLQSEMLLTLVGYLCGECRDGKGVSALLSRCTTCSNASGLLIVLLREVPPAT